MKNQNVFRATFVFAMASCVALPLQADEAPPPVDQMEINALIAEGKGDQAFEDVFEAGDELTEFSFTSDRGVGANIGEGRRFTRFPRADLTGPTDWANHFPKREGGANATSCIACHNAPMANGAGDIALNVVVDPAHSGNPSLFLERNTLPLFALGIPQRLAEEMTQELHQAQSVAMAAACTDGAGSAALSAKGISFGSISYTRTATNPCSVQLDANQLEGVDEDLVIKPFGWKGNEATIRSFTRNAAHNETGMQAVELVGAEDGDFDGVINELTVGDMTALTVYMAALERPVSSLELAEIGLIDLTDQDVSTILAGEQNFAAAECTSCHVAQLTLNDPVFREPSTTAGYFDTTFPDGSVPGNRGLSPTSAVEFDMTKDQPNNEFELADGSTRHLGAMQTAASGDAYARWFTDFKRHDMGAELADPADPLDVGASMFLTRSLAGVGSTGPWLHDGRATTLNEAIEMHGGDAAESRDAYLALSEQQQDEIVAFLDSLVIYVEETEEH